MRIKVRPIKAELQELAGNEKVKLELDREMAIASSISHTDQGYLVKLNPTRIQGPKILEAHLAICRYAITS